MSGGEKQKQSNQTDGEIVFIAMDPKKILSLVVVHGKEKDTFTCYIAFSVCSNTVFSQVAFYENILFSFLFPISYPI